MSKSKMEHSADYEWAIKLNRFSLNVIGLWPVEEQNGTNRFLTKLRATVFLVDVIFVCTIPCLCSLMKECHDLMAAMDNLGYSIPLTIFIMKFMVVLNNKRVLLPIINMIAEDWAKLKTSLERDVMIRRARVAHTVTILSYTLLGIPISLLLILPRFGITVRYGTNETNRTDLFPLPTYYAYDVSEPPYFEIAWAIQSISLIGIVLGYAGIDSFFGILILHICGQLENLRTRMVNMKESETSNRVLTATVKDHIRLIRAVDAIESTFTLSLLALLLYFGIFLSIYGLLITTILVEKEQFSMYRMVYLMCIVASTFIQTSLYCIAGQILVSESEGVHGAAYECEWVSLKPKKAKNLILIMARAKNPLCLTAGKLFPMTMPTICNILKISLSYISFLLTKVQY